MFRRLALIALFAGCAFAAPVLQEIKVSYQLIPVPSSMVPAPSPNIGVLVIVQTDVGSIGKIEVRLDWVDDFGIVHESRQTVSREQTVGGFDPRPIPVLFTLPAAMVNSVEVEGYAPSLVPQIIVQP